MLSNLYSETFTIINQIPQSPSDASIVSWSLHYIDKCHKREGLFDKSGNQMVYIADSWTAYTKNWERYKKPLWIDNGYYALPEYEKDNFYTVNAGDLIVFAEIEDDTPTTLREFLNLRDKYKGNGGIITEAQAYINYKPNGMPWATNHIEITKG